MCSSIYPLGVTSSFNPSLRSGLSTNDSLEYDYWERSVNRKLHGQYSTSTRLGFSTLTPSSNCDYLKMMFNEIGKREFSGRQLSPEAAKVVKKVVQEKLIASFFDEFKGFFPRFAEYKYKKGKQIGSLNLQCKTAKDEILKDIEAFSFDNSLIKRLIESQKLAYFDELPEIFLDNGIKIMLAKTLVEGVTNCLSYMFDQERLGGPAYQFASEISESIAKKTLEHIHNNQTSFRGVETRYESLELDGLEINVPKDFSGLGIDGDFQSIDTLFETLAKVNHKEEISIIIVTGLPGVGKTTLAMKLEKELGFERISLDERAKKSREERVPGSIDTDRPHLLGFLQYKQKTLCDLVQKAVDNGQSVVIDGVCARYFFDTMNIKGIKDTDKVTHCHIGGVSFQERFGRKFKQKEESAGWYGHYMNALVMVLALWATKEGGLEERSAKIADSLIINT